MNDNFLYVGQGSRFPMTSFGADMGYTTGVYDLGSSAYRWSNVYANSISVSGSISASKLMTLEADIIVSVATAKVEILGLNGDNATNFLVVVSSTDKGPLMCINQGRQATGSERLGMVLNNGGVLAEIKHCEV